MAGYIPDRIIEEISFRNDIVELIGSRLTLKRAGSTYKALCPFHKEKTPSFIVNPQRQTYHCFGCGKHGDVYRFLMESDGMDFVTAVRTLAGRAGVEIPVERDDGRSRGRKVLYQLHSQLAAKYHSTLRKSTRAAAARAYLADRGLTDDTVEAFMIGYAPDEWEAVLNWGKSTYSVDLLLEAGLVVQSRKEGRSTRYYDRFRDRLMFPIFDGQGRVVGFSGRILEKDARQAKYVNSPETPIFQKSRVLYAFDKARSQIVSSREALVCEGQIDVIRCHQAGFDTAVAAQGTAFTDDHVTMVKRFADSVVLVFDSDDAGQDAAIKTARLFIAAGMAVRVARLPDGDDPDTYIRREGGGAFGERLKAAESAIAFHVSRLALREDLTKEVGMMRVANDVLQTIVRTPNPVQQTRLLEEAATCLQLPVSALEERMGQIADEEKNRRRGAERRRAADPAPPVVRAAPPVAGPRDEAGAPIEELLLCEHMVHAIDHPELIELVTRYLPLDMISDPRCQSMIRAAIESVRAEVPIEDLVEELNTPEFPLLEFVMEMQRKPIKFAGGEARPADAVKDLILVIWRHKLQAEWHSLGAADSERRAQITYDLNSMKAWHAGAAIIEIELAGRDPSEP